MSWSEADQAFMRAAIGEAKIAASVDEVPVGAIVVRNGEVIGAGLNRSIQDSDPTAHAEIVAISLAQQILRTFDLGGPGMADYQLVVNGRPCAMCYGSIPWSGVRSVVIGASGEQIESLTGFDEGPIHPNWQAELNRRGIEVMENILADEASEVFRDFGNSGQPIYNGRSS